MTQRRFARLTNGFSKKLTNHAAAVSLYVAHYNLCRVHEALRTTPAVALGVTDRVWTIGDLIDTVLPLEPNRPVRVKRNFKVKLKAERTKDQDHCGAPIGAPFPAHEALQE
jgi:hypothetical protein